MSGLTDPVALAALAARIERGQVPALSIKQPYPHHIFHDGKDVENRDWFMKVRGWAMVHAGKSTDELADSQLHLPRGGVVGMMRIDHCVETGRTDFESPWFFGRYGFVIGASFPLPLIPCRGMLGFFDVPVDVRAAVARSVAEYLMNKER
ncbi:hypothetical protein [Sphingomonas montanisoli]|uniref:Uncharacterized protein n=1 Tax=Sphingomonas montanisoli TaxID=2606412 RepID=A0A5D9C8W8_9SPHN|nr:hypothetical protein [Sphingomonas montanisoli]TZG26491.1 hypothetical protein FYJ91_16345 [Sphingomonas montanisoli]